GRDALGRDGARQMQRGGSGRGVYLAHPGRFARAPAM
ncbi:MAG: hypothetical protein AVDCRST_MAG03-2798, partial [uncultured Rubrobacteraceae bacterium]